MLAAPAAAECRLALILALDISASVDGREDELQRKGLARAMLAPAVVEALLAQPDRPVWLSVFEWSGPKSQVLLLDWLEIAGEEDVALAAGAIATSKRSRDDSPTALGDALGFASVLFQNGPACAAYTLDVSGDGRSNDGPPPRLAYQWHSFANVTVNGLAIAGDEAGVETYYRKELIRGAGAFVIVAKGFRDYERAMREKLLRELRGPVIGLLKSRRAG
ncbi:MAG: DUF1194 domain-containing protein [Paracoccaceae bacterium]